MAIFVLIYQVPLIRWQDALSTLYLQRREPHHTCCTCLIMVSLV